MTTSVLYKTPAGHQAVMAIYDTAMEHWAVPYTTRMIPTRHGNTFVVVSGDEHAPAMILLHGSGGNSSIWAGDVRDYCSQFRVYAVDLPGEAGKSDPNRPAWESPAFAEWLEDVLNGLAIQKVTLVGVSQGGWTALKFAVTAPQRVESLILIAPGGIVADRPLFLIRAIVLMLFGSWGVRRMVHALFGDQAVSRDVEDIVVQITSQFKPRIGVVPIFSDEELRRLVMPMLLLGGTKDIIRDIDKIASRLRNLVPNLTVTLIPGGGHALQYTSDHVIKFLNCLKNPA